MKKLSNLFIIIPFLIIIFSVPIISIIKKDENFSNEEYRNLTTIQTLKENKFSPDYIEKYLVDQFPYRKNFLKLYTIQEMLLNKIYIRDTYLIDKNLILSKEYKLNNEDAKNLFDLIEEKQSIFKNSKFYYATLPSKTYALRELAKKYIDISIPEKNKQLIKNNIPKNINFIDTNKFLDENFSLNEKLNLYYKTDFHWNGKGALECTLYILNEILKNENFNLKINKNDFQIEILNNKTFLGDLNRRFSYLIENDTQIPIISNNDEQYSSYYKSLDNTKKVAKNEIISSGLNKDFVDYNDIYTHNLNFYKIINENALLNKKIIIFKDSYQNPTTDIFSHIFKECYIIDARSKQENNFDELMKKINPDIVLFMFHQSNISKEIIEYLKN